MTATSAPIRARSRSEETLPAAYRPLLVEIAAGAVERERERRLPRREIELLKRSGFTAARVPADAGGDGATLPELFALIVELATADANLAQALRGHFAFVEDRLYAAHSTDRDHWLERFAAGEIAGNAVTEIGSVALGDTATKLHPARGGWTIRGRKYYTTGSIFAEWIDATALTPDGREVAALVRTGGDEVTISDDWSGFGQRLTGSGTVVFDDAPVEPAHVYDFDARFPYQTAFYQLVLNAVLAGIARATERDVVAALAHRNRAFSHGNASRPARDPQLLEIVGRIAASAFAADAAVQSAATVLQRAFDARGADDEEVGRRKRESELASANAQLVVTRAAAEATSTLFDALGASATDAATALDRHWRNARTIQSHNPVAFKARIVGDALVNGAEPPYEWYVGIASEPAEPVEP